MVIQYVSIWMPIRIYVQFNELRYEGNKELIKFKTVAARTEF